MDPHVIIATRVVIRALAPTLNKAAATALDIFKLKQEQKAFQLRAAASKPTEEPYSEPQGPIRVTCERLS